MKKTILSILLYVFGYSTFAQSYEYITIKTPTNISIEANQKVEVSNSTLVFMEEQAADWIRIYGSNAIRVAPATVTYNCHSYAWHYSDGGNKVWIN